MVNHVKCHTEVKKPGDGEGSRVGRDEEVIENVNHGSFAAMETVYTENLKAVI